MAVRLGDIAPDFTADTTEGTISFHEWLGDSWGVLFSHPKDFTPVCTTEFSSYVADQAGVRQAQRQGGRTVRRPDRRSRPLGRRHRRDPGDPTQLPADRRRRPHRVRPLRLIHPNANDTLTVRSVFVIGPDKKVKLTLTYPASTGRNFDELLGDRLAAAHRQPQGRHAGQLEPGRRRHHRLAVSDDEAAELFPNGWNTVRPYLRITAQPGS